MAPVLGIIVSPSGIGEITILAPGSGVDTAARLLARVAPLFPALWDAARCDVGPAGGSAEAPAGSTDRTVRGDESASMRPPNLRRGGGDTAKSLTGQPFSKRSMPLAKSGRDGRVVVARGDSSPAAG